MPFKCRKYHLKLYQSKFILYHGYSMQYYSSLWIKQYSWCFLVIPFKWCSWTFNWHSLPSITYLCQLYHLISQLCHLKNQQIACLPSDTTHTVQVTQFVFQVTQLAYQVISQLDKPTVSLEKPTNSLLIKWHSSLFKWHSLLFKWHNWLTNWHIWLYKCRKAVSLENPTMSSKRDN